MDGRGVKKNEIHEQLQIKGTRDWGGITEQPLHGYLHNLTSKIQQIYDFLL